MSRKIEGRVQFQKKERMKERCRKRDPIIFVDESTSGKKEEVFVTSKS
jgi:hypothetical protein